MRGLAPNILTPKAHLSNTQAASRAACQATHNEFVDQKSHLQKINKDYISSLETVYKNGHFPQDMRCLADGYQWRDRIGTWAPLVGLASIAACIAVASIISGGTVPIALAVVGAAAVSVGVVVRINAQRVSGNAWVKREANKVHLNDQLIANALHGRAGINSINAKDNQSEQKLFATNPYAIANRSYSEGVEKSTIKFANKLLALNDQEPMSLTELAIAQRVLFSQVSGDKKTRSQMERFVHLLPEFVVFARQHATTFNLYSAQPAYEQAYTAFIERPSHINVNKDYKPLSYANTVVSLGQTQVLAPVLMTADDLRQFANRDARQPFIIQPLNDESTSVDNSSGRAPAALTQDSLLIGKTIESIVSLKRPEKVFTNPSFIGPKPQLAQPADTKADNSRVEVEYYKVWAKVAIATNADQVDGFAKTQNKKLLTQQLEKAHLLRCEMSAAVHSNDYLPEALRDLQSQSKAVFTELKANNAWLNPALLYTSAEANHQALVHGQDPTWRYSKKPLVRVSQKLAVKQLQAIEQRLTEFKGLYALPSNTNEPIQARIKADAQVLFTALQSGTTDEFIRNFVQRETAQISPTEHTPDEMTRYAANIKLLVNEAIAPHFFDQEFEVQQHLISMVQNEKDWLTLGRAGARTNLPAYDHQPNANIFSRYNVFSVVNHLKRIDNLRKNNAAQAIIAKRPDDADKHAPISPRDCLPRVPVHLKNEGKGNFQAQFHSAAMMKKMINLGLVESPRIFDGTQVEPKDLDLETGERTARQFIGSAQQMSVANGYLDQLHTNKHEASTGPLETCDVRNPIAARKRFDAAKDELVHLGAHLKSQIKGVVDVNLSPAEILAAVGINGGKAVQNKHSLTNDLNHAVNIMTLRTNLAKTQANLSDLSQNIKSYLNKNSQASQREGQPKQSNGATKIHSTLQTTIDQKIIKRNQSEFADALTSLFLTQADFLTAYTQDAQRPAHAKQFTPAQHAEFKEISSIINKLSTNRDFHSVMQTSYNGIHSVRNRRDMLAFNNGMRSRARLPWFKTKSFQPTLDEYMKNYKKESLNNSQTFKQFDKALESINFTAIGFGNTLSRNALSQNAQQATETHNDIGILESFSA